MLPNSDQIEKAYRIWCGIVAFPFVYGFALLCAHGFDWRRR